LLLAVERLVVGNSAKQALAAAAVGLTAREDVGPVVAALGVAVILLSLRQDRVGRADDAHSVTQPSRERHVSVMQASRERHASVAVGIALAGMGFAWTVLSAVIIGTYSGGVSPFEVRYGATLGAGWAPAMEALTRKSVLDYAGTLLLSG